MIQKVDNLWSDALTTRVATPFAILKAQAEYLHELSGGLLRGDVQVFLMTHPPGAESEDEPVVEVRFAAVAPAFRNLRRELLVVRYRKLAVYPAALFAREGIFKNPRDVGPPFYDPKQGDNFVLQMGTMADNEAEFIDLVRTVLRSEHTNETLAAMIGAINDDSVSSDQVESKTS